jgi:Tfp pilus assembly protein PilX
MKKTQQGVILLVSLVILVILSILAISSMRITMSQGIMASSSLASDFAFNSSLDARTQTLLDLKTFATLPLNGVETPIIPASGQTVVLCITQGGTRSTLIQVVNTGAAISTCSSYTTRPSITVQSQIARSAFSLDDQITGGCQGSINGATLVYSNLNLDTKSDITAINSISVQSQQTISNCEMQN